MLLLVVSSRTLLFILCALTALTISSPATFFVAVHAQQGTPAPSSGNNTYLTDNLWTGAAGDGLWTTAANWQLGTVPDTGYRAVIRGATVTVSGLLGPYSVGGLEMTAAATLVLKAQFKIWNTQHKIDSSSTIRLDGSAYPTAILVAGGRMEGTVVVATQSQLSEIHTSGAAGLSVGNLIATSVYLDIKSEGSGPRGLLTVESPPSKETTPELGHPAAPNTLYSSQLLLTLHSGSRLAFKTKRLTVNGLNVACEPVVWPPTCGIDANETVVTGNTTNAAMNAMSIVVIAAPASFKEWQNVGKMDTAFAVANFSIGKLALRGGVVTVGTVMKKYANYSFHSSLLDVKKLELGAADGAKLYIWKTGTARVSSLSFTKYAYINATGTPYCCNGGNSGTSKCSGPLTVGGARGVGSFIQGDAGLFCERDEHSIPKSAAQAIGGTVTAVALAFAIKSPELASVNALQVVAGFLSCASHNMRNYAEDNRWSLFPLAAAFDSAIENPNTRDFVSCLLLLVIILALNGGAFLLVGLITKDARKQSFTFFPNIFLAAASVFTVPFTFSTLRVASETPASLLGTLPLLVGVVLIQLRCFWQRIFPDLFALASLKTSPHVPFAPKENDEEEGTCTNGWWRSRAIPKVIARTFWRPWQLTRRFSVLFAAFGEEEDSNNDDLRSEILQTLVNEEPGRGGGGGGYGTSGTTATGSNNNNINNGGKFGGIKKLLCSAVGGAGSDIFSRSGTRFQLISVMCFVLEGVAIGASSEQSSCHIQVGFLLFFFVAHSLSGLRLRPRRHGVINWIFPLLILVQGAILAAYFNGSSSSSSSSYLHKVAFLPLEFLYCFSLIVTGALEFWMSRKYSEEEERLQGGPPPPQQQQQEQEQEEDKEEEEEPVVATSESLTTQN